MKRFQIFKRKIRTVINKPTSVPIKLLYALSPLIGDKIYLKMLFPLMVGYKLDLDNPQTYNEKLQWLKLYYRKPVLTTMVDKYEAKIYVAELIGEKYIIPTLGVWDTFEDINFDELPNQFVLKTTHDSGGVVICKNKNTFDYKNARNKLNSHLKLRHFYLTREWPYKNIKPRIIAEELMITENGEDINDFKFFCFDGIPKSLFIATDRQSGHVKFDYFDMNFKHLQLIQEHENSKDYISKPQGFDKMVELAKILSADLPHVRVDFYDIDGEIYFGELTFFHFGGLVPFEPEEWDYTFGSWIGLPEKTNLKN